MEQSIKNRLLESIGKVYESAKGCKLESAFFQEIQAEIGVISGYFGLTNMQSLLVAMVFSLNYKGNTVDFSDLIDYFECNPMKLLEYSDDFAYLYSKRIFIKEKSSHRIKLALSNDQFTINEKITEAILNNMPLPQLSDEQVTDVIELLAKINNFGQQRENDEISTSMLYVQLKNLICNNLRFPLIQMVNDFNFKNDDIFMYLYLIWKTLNSSESEDLEKTSNVIFDNPTRRIKYVQKIMSNENELLQQNLIEILETKYFHNIRVKLTEKSCKLIEDCGLKFLSKGKVNRDNIFEPAQIFAKTLYFNEKETKQLGLLRKILLEENFKEAQIRLEGKGLPMGIIALLHGLPGTGKTETAFQLAKETNREIMKVDISQSKSMWFGESEKNIKRMFTNYKMYAKECERKPILLFNEADAILGKRKDIGSSNTDQTENTIQNILLDELEHFDGIFVATTNLVKNLDSAFERRFLFKIEFLKPEISIKAKIWQSKLPSLTENESEMLAARFDFSGGQIDNIIRKNEIYEIIHGMSVDFPNIVAFCQAELLVKNSCFKVGFTNT